MVCVSFLPPKMDIDLANGICAFIFAANVKSEDATPVFSLSGNESTSQFHLCFNAEHWSCGAQL